MNVHYRTALIWLDLGLVPGAKRVKTLAGEHWEIPIKALKMTPPKPGPKAAGVKAVAKKR